MIDLDCLTNYGAYSVNNPGSKDSSQTWDSFIPGTGFALVKFGDTFYGREKILAFNNSLWLAKTRIFILVFASLTVFVGCGGFKARQHPDDFFKDGRNISSFDELDAFMDSSQANPRFRKAEVTTQSGSLKLKMEPDPRAPTPPMSPDTLANGQEIEVFWPLDIVNNHIKILYAGQTFWVTYGSSKGGQYVTLLENLSIPKVSSLGSFVDVRSGEFGSNDGPTQITPPAGALSFNIDSIFLPSSAIQEARTAIRAVHLEPIAVRSCNFDPLIGNNSSPNNCYEEIVISRDFRDFIAQHGYSCARQAAQNVFNQVPQKILFHSSYGGQVRRNRSVSGTLKKSIHSVGQAIDLFGVSLFFGSNNARKILLHKNQTDGSSPKERQNHRFYWGYVNCWRERIRSYAPCNCDSELSGAITYLQNSAHHNHVHMSLPLCERSRFNVSCV